LQRPDGKTEVVMFYPSDSLACQIAAWMERWPHCLVAASFAESISGMRRAAARGRLVLLDATRDPSRARAALALVLAWRGPEAVVAYTEKMHPGLELFVRARGAMLLLGPLSVAQWHGLFQKRLILPTDRRRKGVGLGGRLRTMSITPEGGQPTTRRTLAGAGRRNVGVKPR
jgi:hypothetical protein